jgi:hypothetical protein
VSGLCRAHRVGLQTMPATRARSTQPALVFLE